MAKRNKMLRKVLVTMCSAVLLVGATVGVTVAYLTSTTQVVKNTFTIGNVAITLDEALVDEYGEKQGEERTEDGNEYRLVPKHTYVKDPTVTVKKDSDEAYVRVLVTVNNRAYLDELFATRGYSLETVIGGYDPTLWELASNKIK